MLIESDNPSGADNQQARSHGRASTTTCTAPQLKRGKHKGQEGYKWCDLRLRWVREIRDNLARCSHCGKWKILGSFTMSRSIPDSICKECRRFQKAASRYKISIDEARQLYAKEQCDCCGAFFEKQTHKHIHHIGDTVRGIVCLYCNHTLRDESPEHLRRLKCCVDFVIGG